MKFIFYLLFSGIVFIVKGQAIVISPAKGNSDSIIANAIQQSYKSHLPIRLMAGFYNITRPIMFALPASNAYQQVSFDFGGITGGRNTPIDNCAVIKPLFNNAPAIIVQNGKGFKLSNLVIDGQFTFPDRLNQIQVDTLPFSAWTDGKCIDAPTTPYAGIAIDPFSDPKYLTAGYPMYPTLKQYYISGMSMGGSTAGEINNVTISHFVVDFIITCAYQANGEIISVNNCQFQSAKVAYAMTQAQSKDCQVNDLECWANTHTIFDNRSYGINKGDGANSPVINGSNFAGAIHQIFNILSPSFPVSVNNLYAEGVFKFGCIISPFGGQLSNCQIDFQDLQDKLPMPDFHIYENGIVNTACMFRLYPGLPLARINWLGNFRTVGGYTNQKPLVYSFVTTNNNPNDSAIGYFSFIRIHVNDDFSGYFISDAAYLQGSKLRQGDMIVTSGEMLDQFKKLLQGTRSIARVDHVSSDTVFLKNIAWGVNNNVPIQCWCIRQKVN